jgi:branched-subunit amino acid transport protein AzlD
VIFGGVLEIIVALACIGTAVVLYPVVKRQNEAAALGFVGVRVLEASTIFLCVVSLLSVVTLRQAGVGADGLLASQALVAFHDWIFLLGQGFLPAVNALLLGSLLYQSRLVPRVLPVIGFIGAGRFRRRHVVRPLGPALGGVGHPYPPDRCVGVLSRRLSDRQRL